MRYTKEDINKAIEIMLHMDFLIQNGEREGWGYDPLSINRVIAMLNNEIKMRKEIEQFNLEEQMRNIRS